MGLVEISPSVELRVILCLKFDSRAPLAEVATLKRELIECDYVLNSVEVSGSFDFMFEAALSDFAAYQAHIDRFATQMSAFVERHEANFVCRRFVRAQDRSQAIWVPTRDGRRRIDCNMVKVVRAEGDYVRIFCEDATWLLHDTMHHVRELFDSGQFMTLHRSAMVNRDFIQKLIHRRNHWVALLGDGSEQRIAKSHVAEVLRELRSGEGNGPNGSS